MDIKEIVTKYFFYVNTRDWDGYLSLFDDNVVMDEQLLGRVEGIDKVAEGIEGLRNSPKFFNHMREFIADGERAMAVWHIETVGPNGEDIQADGVNYFKVANGKIVYFANFHDSAPFKPILEAS